MLQVLIVGKVIEIDYCPKNKRMLYFTLENSCCEYGYEYTGCPINSREYFYNVLRSECKTKLTLFYLFSK